MKPELRRIETTLQHLEGQRQAPSAPPASAPPRSPQLPYMPPRTAPYPTPQPPRPVSPPGGINPPPRSTGLPPMRSPQTPHAYRTNPANPPRPISPPSFRVQSPPQSSSPQRPPTPQAQPAPPPPPPQRPPAPSGGQITHVPAGRLSHHRHNVNPALATNILREIEAVIVGWQRELKQILIQIQNLYLEGPMVDGWLESQEADPARSLPQTARQQIESNYGRVSYEFPRSGYRLCGRDDQGRVWSKPCPPHQVAGVSMAIARYQKLRQLLKKKQGLEQRLSNIAETLVLVHRRLKS
ncbi:hypothetical protein PN441_09610 [Spirulina major CS-329]|uniref:hypothetical protein n=1 Tax=Spirulina TaxID=1154 RepID=UPI00232E35F4|nr:MULTISPECIES: hypothetical protein [Spirulina]MDB9493248.1 hypothetical protein [Spirulina subsalsa CS-330]MDB9503326.1 hypothetical protein [Spirulina major CS-329]